jgi:hypothetical protein
MFLARAVLILSSLFAFSAFAEECDCGVTVTMGPPIVFSEDPILLVDGSFGFHAQVDEIYFDAGECVVLVTFPDGDTAAYTEASGHEVRRLKLAPHIAAHPAFAGMGGELTLGEVSAGAAKICSPTFAGEPAS